MIPFAAILLGFSGIGEQIFVEPDVVHQFVVFIFLVRYESPDELPRIVNLVGTGCRAVATVVENGNFFVPRPAVVHVQKQLFADVVG